MFSIVSASGVLGAIPGDLGSAGRVLLAVAVVVFLVARRLYGGPLSARRVLVAPLAFVVIGVIDFAQDKPAHLGLAGVAVLVTGGVISLVVGAVRGASIELFSRDGYLWQRYRLVTLGLWVVSAAARWAVVGIGHVAGAPAAVGTTSLFLMLGISLLGEALFLAPRALASGVPFALDLRGSLLTSRLQDTLEPLRSTRTRRAFGVPRRRRGR